MSITEDITGTVLSRLAEIADLLRDLIRNAEQEPDFDATYVCAGTQNAASVATIGPLPRTLKHVEITFQVANNQSTGQNIVALIAGNIDLITAGNIMSPNQAVAQAGGAICATMGGTVTVRDYLDGSGYLTIYNAATAGKWAYTVRIRSLDAVQGRGQRT